MICCLLVARTSAFSIRVLVYRLSRTIRSKVNFARATSTMAASEEMNDGRSFVRNKMYFQQHMFCRNITE